MFSRSVILQASSFERLSILFYNSGWYHERPFAVVSRCVQRCEKAIIIMEVLHRAGHLPAQPRPAWRHALCARPA